MTFVLRPPLCAALVLALSTACGGDEGGAKKKPGGAPDGGVPTGLPFDFERPASGTPPTDAENQAFTKAVTGFWKNVDYYRWQTWIAHGLHESYDASMPDYALWWQDTDAVKAGDTVTFRHRGGADNIMIRTPKVLSAAISGYLASGDPIMKQLVISYSKGVVALFLGMHWGNEEPDEFITARAIFTHDHAYTVDGRKIAVDYRPMFGAACTAHDECPGDHTKCPVAAETGIGTREPAATCCEKGFCTIYNWNAHTAPNTSNPHFGSIWVRNMRSQDDVPHMYRVAPLLMRAAEEAPDEDVRAATAEAARYLRGFAKDVVDHGYQIRTKQDGRAFVPLEPNGLAAKDLASFVRFEALAPNGQCNAKLTSALLGTGAAADNDCESGLNEVYEPFAVSTNYYNYAIIRSFHIAAVEAALALRVNDVAEALLAGLADRSDAAMADAKSRAEHSEWDADVAAYLLASATAGLPLTADEAKLVQREYADAATFYEKWDKWDLWDPSVPDGTHGWTPPDDDGTRVYVRPEEMGFLLHYCESPFKNPTTVEIVDCAAVLDPSRW